MQHAITRSSLTRQIVVATVRTRRSYLGSYSKPFSLLYSL
jgi:hypothetical protein